MSQTTVSASVARPIRGAGQAGLAYGILALIASFHHFTPDQFGALLLVASAVVTYLHNLAEDKGWIPAVLKAEPTTDPVPVVDTTISDAAAEAVKETTAKKTTARKRAAKKTAGHVDLGTVLAAALIVLVVVVIVGLIFGFHHR
jgi:hypothetical protein